MRVLLTNNTLAILAGSETFSYALAVKLKERGHEVACFSERLGQVSAKLKEHGIPSVEDFSRLPWKPDVIHAHHPAGTVAVRSHIGVPSVFVSHGLIPHEQPQFKPDALVAVSEETRTVLELKGLRVDAVIRNAIDTKRFNYSPIRPNGKRVLFVSNYASGREAALVERACAKVGASFNCLGLRFGFQTWEIEKAYYNADVVVGLGRTVIEAMSMGRNAIVFDAGHPIAGVPQLRGDGLVTPGTYKEIRRHNFSGRRWNNVRTVETLAEELKKATPENARQTAAIIRREHDIEKAVDRYIELYQLAIERNAPQAHQPGTGKPAPGGSA